ncbi:MAG: carboxypeptidase regulatory-like domain-containing protein [Chitinophagaceae bacterium]|nr:MAG: carboxypeptidase regulatory-like domain-containing protein [Chitinophagaceae bacterium]
MKSVIFLFAMTLAGYSANAAIDPEPGDCSGRKEEVLGLIQHAENKKPLARVNITAYLLSQKQKSVVSDENGNYSFDDLKPGTYRLTFEKAGFKKVTKDKVVIKTDEGFLINIEMEETRPLEFGPSALHFSDF